MFDAWRHRFSLLTVGATLFLIFAGGMVTSTESGLAVPDWPLSYGMLMPPMVGGIFYEHGHRMVASTVGFLTLVLAFWTARREARRGVRRLAWTALAVVVLQGVLGGLTVIFLLPTPISVGHACLAQAFFCLTIALAYSTSREWLDASGPVIDPALVRRAAVVATAVVYGQLVLGASMRHLHAGLAIHDFPLSLGRVIPPFDAPGVAIAFSHRAFAVCVLAAVVFLALAARRSAAAALRSSANLALGLTLVQVGLGAATVLSEKEPVLTSLHVVTGAAVLGACFLTALRAFRLTLAPRPQPLEPAAALRVAA
jgi:cytochrome c oxidase assembly protein subunit 15